VYDEMLQMRSRNMHRLRNLMLLLPELGQRAP